MELNVLAEEKAILLEKEIVELKNQIGQLNEKIQ